MPASELKRLDLPLPVSGERHNGLITGEREPLPGAAHDRTRGCQPLLRHVPVDDLDEVAQRRDPVDERVQRCHPCTHSVTYPIGDAHEASPPIGGLGVGDGTAIGAGMAAPAGSGAAARAARTVVAACRSRSAAAGSTPELSSAA